MLVLRWKYHGERGWKVPPNLHIGKTEIPIGLLSVFLVLLSVAIVNLFTKSVATVSGIVFAAAFFVIFTVSERLNLRRHAITARQMKDHFQLEHQDTISRESTAIRPGAIMVTMRDAANPLALKWTLSRTDTDEKDIVVISVRMMGAGGPEYLSAEEQSFSEHEQMIFTKAVSVAESLVRKYHCWWFPPEMSSPRWCRALTRWRWIRSFPESPAKCPPRIRHSYGTGWEALAEPKRQFNFYVIGPAAKSKYFTSGRTRQPKSDDVQLVHRLWLNMRRDPSVPDLHHSDIITYALTRLPANMPARSRRYCAICATIVQPMLRRVSCWRPAALQHSG